MTWSGLKRVAFVPVHRSNAHPPDQPVPADWPAEILKRALYDPNGGGGADRSLRSYIHTASSGRADLDAVVMPMRTIDEQDVPPDRFEGEIGAELRDAGFHAAALVMLGGPGPGAGTAQRGGFWARFATHNTKHVIYRSGDGRLHELWWVPGGGMPAHVDLTSTYGLPSAADDPSAFTVGGPNTQHVAFRGTDGHLHEVVW